MTTRRREVLLEFKCGCGGVVSLRGPLTMPAHAVLYCCRRRKHTGFVFNTDGALQGVVFDANPRAWRKR